MDDKYQYSSENKDNTVHGWITQDDSAPVGFWLITPSNEFRHAGPIKQDLTSHVGPTTLSVSSTCGLLLLALFSCFLHSLFAFGMINLKCKITFQNALSLFIYRITKPKGQENIPQRVQEATAQSVTSKHE